MTSEVGICNKAALKVGGATFISFTDGTTESNFCSENYASLRDAVLEAHDWSFATKRATLAASATVPDSIYAKQYPIPTTWLRVLEVNQQYWDDPNKEWEIEDNHIVTNDTTCKAKYIAKVTDVDKFTPTFVEALACLIASGLAVPVAQNLDLMKSMYQLAESKITRSASIDNGQGRMRRARATWLQNARNGYGGLGGRSNAFGPTV